MIEQLGGYEKARQYAKNYHSIDFDISSFDRLLLQYRREHNIFEDDDLVCVKFNNKLLRIYHIYQNIDDEDGYCDGSEEVCLECISTDYSTHTYLSDIRHATDAEIKAGRRL